jgi:hypothetical protein
VIHEISMVSNGFGCCLDRGDGVVAHSWSALLLGFWYCLEYGTRIEWDLFTPFYSAAGLSLEVWSGRLCFQIRFAA